MTITAHIDKAGKYPVAQIPCPNFSSEAVNLSLPRAGVLHTTEGGWDGSMGVFRVHYAPHFIVGVNAHHTAAMRFGVKTPPEPVGDVQIAQLVPIGTIGAACVTHNDHAIVQIEVVGYAREEPWLFEAGTLDALSSLMLVCRDEWGIPLSHPWPDGDYGRAGDNPHRHAGKLGKVAGWYNHGDMPAPDNHWDSGNLQWSKLFAHAASLDKPSPALVS